MKVLSNMRIFGYIKQALKIWGYTGLFGGIVLIISLAIYGFPLNSADTPTSFALSVFVIGFVFSFPAAILLIPNFYILSIIPTKQDRFAYSLVSVFVLSIAVILFFFWIFRIPDSWGILFLFLLPYIISAEISFLLVSRRVIKD